MKMMKTAATLLALLSVALLVGAQDDYVLDLKWGPSDVANGYMSTDAVTFGAASTTYTFEILVKARAAGTIFDFDSTPKYDTTGASRITLSLTSGNVNLNVAGTALSGSYSWSTSNWYQFVVVLDNSAHTAKVYVLPLATTTTTISPVISGTIPAIPSVARVGFLGAAINRGGSYVTDLLNAQLDDFRLWMSVDRTPTTTGPTLDVSYIEVDAAGLFFEYAFNDYPFEYAVGFPGPMSISSHPAQYIGALNNEGCAWVLSKKDETYRTCSGTGDPHYTTPTNSHFDTPHVPGYFIIQQCSNGAFTVKTKQVTGCCWGGATVIGELILENFGSQIKITLDGQYLYATGADTWAPLSGSYGTLDSGANWELSVSSNYFRFVAPQGGWITVNVYVGKYMNIYLAISSVCEDCSGGYSVCAGTSNPRLGDLSDSAAYRRFTTTTTCKTPGTSSSADDDESWFVSQSSYDSEARTDPCDEVTAQFSAQADAVCQTVAYNYVTKEIDETVYDDCMFDACATGIIDPGCIGANCDSCLMQQMQAAADGDIAPACVDDCPQDCSGHGVCDASTATCTCDSGYTGTSCSQRSEWNCFAATTTDGGATINVLPYDLSSDMNFPAATSLPSIADVLSWVTSYGFHVRDSILFYATTMTYLGTEQVAIVIAASDVSSRDAGSATVTITGPSDISSKLTVIPATCALTSGCVASSSISGNTVYLNWNAGTTTAAVLGAPSTGQYTIDVSYDGQILVGSNMKNNKLDVVKYDATRFYFNADLCTDNDECASKTTCTECAANTKCGWCRDTNQCFVGTASGPSTKTTCSNWRYSFDDDVSRALTTSFGWPVSPDSEEVYLTDLSTADDLPIDLVVDVGDTETTPWDLIWIMSAQSGNNEADINTYNTFAADIYSALTSRSVAWATAKYGYAGQYSIMTTITSSKPDYTAFKNTLTRLQLYTNPGTSSLGAQLSAIYAIAHPDIDMGWHSTAKRVILITADSDYDESVTSVATVKAALLDKNIIPVFAVTSAYQDSYEALVTELGFGVVLSLQENSMNLPTVINQALTRVIGNVFLLFDGEGYVDVDNYKASETNIYGLTSEFRARFVIPVAPETDGDKTETITVPGYGTASINNVESDKPWTTGDSELHTNEDYTDELFGYKGGLIFLSGAAYKNLPSSVLVYITVLPENGNLYAFSENADATGAQITTVPYLLTDPLGRIIYEPDANKYAATNSPLDVLKYKVFDLCQYSEESVVQIYVAGENDAPTVSLLSSDGVEDTPVVIKLAYSDIENDPADFVIVTLPSDPEWEEDVTPSGAIGKLYQYSDALAADVSATADAVEITVAGTVVTDSQGRVIYVPPANANSEYSPPSLQVYPWFEFYAQETSCCSDYVDTVRRSGSLKTQIMIAAVNDKPTLWSSSKRSTLDDIDSFCYKTCTYAEDFGYSTGQKYDPVTLYAGGYDIELSDLTLEVSAVSCPAATLTTLDGTEVAVGTTVSGLPQGKLSAAFLFKPLADDFGTAYCTVSYYVYDDQNARSDDAWTITINIMAVDDLPVLDTTVETTWESTPIDFSLEAHDVDSDLFYVSFVSCTGSGTVTYDGVDVLTLTSPITYGPLALTYTPPANMAKAPLLTCEIELNDDLSVEVDPSDHGFLQINVLPLNDGPMIKRETDTDYSYDITDAITVEPNTIVGLPFQAMDIDSADNPISVTMTLTSDSATASISMTVPPTIALIDIGTTVNVQEIVFKTPQEYLDTLLTSVTFTDSQESDSVFTLIIDDLGFTGACSKDNTKACSKTASATVSITVAAASDPIDAVTVGSVSAAGAVAGLAAAAVLYKIFRKPTNPAEYHPWSMDGTSEGAVENPLYKAADNAGSNPLYNMGGASS